MSIALEIIELQKSFGSKVIHRSVSFQLKKGEILGLFGGSGSGKSTILRSIIGLETPDSGSILFKNQNLVNLPEKSFFPIRTQIGYAFQNGALFDSLTVEENLAYPLLEHTALDPQAIELRINEMLALVDLVGTNALYPNELSGGMQKRAGLARATILGPEIILFDEPTAGLDPANTQRLMINMKKLQQQGMTALFVTHDIASAFQIADRIAILHQGRIHAIDSVARIQASTDPVVQAFTHAEGSFAALSRS